ncbi:hypothetical protein E2320_022387, partial [Naja naja]
RPSQDPQSHQLTPTQLSCLRRNKEKKQRRTLLSPAAMGKAAAKRRGVVAGAVTIGTAVVGTETVIVDAAGAGIAAAIIGVEAAIGAAVGIVIGEPADLGAEITGGKKESATAAHLPQDDGLDTARVPCSERKAPFGEYCNMDEGDD